MEQNYVTVTLCVGGAYQSFCGSRDDTDSSIIV